MIRGLLRGRFSLWLLVSSFTMIMLVASNGWSIISALKDKETYKRRYPFERCYSVMTDDEEILKQSDAEQICNILVQYPAERKEITFQDMGHELTLDFSDHYADYLAVEYTKIEDPGIYLGNSYENSDIKMMKVLGEDYRIKGIYPDDGVPGNSERITIPWNELTEGQKSKLAAALKSNISETTGIGIGIRIGSEKDTSRDLEVLLDVFAKLQINVRPINIFQTEGDYGSRSSLYKQIGCLIMIFCTGYAVVVVYIWLRKVSGEIVIRRLLGYELRSLDSYLIVRIQKCIMVSFFLFLLIEWPVSYILKLYGIGNRTFLPLTLLICAIEALSAIETIVFVWKKLSDLPKAIEELRAS